MEITVTKNNQNLTYKRSFEKLDANFTEQYIAIYYKEDILLNGELINSQVKSYNIDFEEWKASEIGQTIINAINTRLQVL
jgi:hypothetical protein